MKVVETETTGKCITTVGELVAALELIDQDCQLQIDCMEKDLCVQKILYAPESFEEYENMGGMVWAHIITGD